MFIYLQPTETKEILDLAAQQEGSQRGRFAITVFTGLVESVTHFATFLLATSGMVLTLGQSKAIREAVPHHFNSTFAAITCLFIGTLGLFAPSLGKRTIKYIGNRADTQVQAAAAKALGRLRDTLARAKEEAVVRFSQTQDTLDGTFFEGQSAKFFIEKEQKMALLYQQFATAQNKYSALTSIPRQMEPLANVTKEELQSFIKAAIKIDSLPEAGDSNEEVREPLPKEEVNEPLLKEESKPSEVTEDPHVPLLHGNEGEVKNDLISKVTDSEKGDELGRVSEGLEGDNDSISLSSFLSSSSEEGSSMESSGDSLQSTSPFWVDLNKNDNKDYYEQMAADLADKAYRQVQGKINARAEQCKMDPDVQFDEKKFFEEASLIKREAALLFSDLVTTVESSPEKKKSFEEFTDQIALYLDEFAQRISELGSISPVIRLGRLVERKVSHYLR